MNTETGEKETNQKPFKVGDGTPGPGRPKGIPNKATNEFRKTISALLDGNKDNVSVWLNKVANGHGDAKPDPAKALDLMAKLAEYAAPKLNRTEVEHSGNVTHTHEQWIDGLK